MAYLFSKSTPANGAEAMYLLKTLLKSCGWTVPMSGDNTTYFAASDGITGFGTGAGGLARTGAWFRIQDPAGVEEYVIQRGTTNLEWRIMWSPLSKFLTGAPAAAVTPDPAVGATLWGGGTSAAPTYGAFFHTDGGLYRCHIGADNAAPYGWWHATNLNGGGLVQTAFVHEPITAYAPGDGSLHLVYLCTVVNSGHPFIGRSGFAGMINEVAVGNRNRISTYFPAATPATLINLPALNIGPVDACIPGFLPVNPLSMKDEVFPIPYAKRITLTNTGWKGVGTQMKWIGTARAVAGDTLNVAGTRDRIVYNDVSLPWDGTVPL